MTDGKISYRSVTDYVDGPNLQDFYAKERLAEEDVILVIRQLAGALDFCLENGIVHRDVKPDNVVIRPTRPVHITLIDFGESIKVDPRAVEAKTLQQPMGKRPYRDPETEQKEGQPKPPLYNYKCDCWSVGVFAYFLLTKKTLFEGKDEEVAYLNGKPKLSEAAWKGDLKQAADFIRNLVSLAVDNRMSYKRMLKHPWLNPKRD